MYQGKFRLTGETQGKYREFWNGFPVGTLNMFHCINRLWDIFIYNFFVYSWERTASPAGNHVNLLGHLKTVLLNPKFISNVICLLYNALFPAGNSVIIMLYFSFFPPAESELHRQLATMPIRSDTLRLRTKKEELERKIAEVEEAIKIFSRPKVFVKMDSWTGEEKKRNEKAGGGSTKWQKRRTVEVGRLGEIKGEHLGINKYVNRGRQYGKKKTPTWLDNVKAMFKLSVLSRRD